MTRGGGVGTSREPRPATPGDDRGDGDDGGRATQPRAAVRPSRDLPCDSAGAPPLRLIRDPPPGAAGVIGVSPQGLGNACVRYVPRTHLGQRFSGERLFVPWPTGCGYSQGQAAEPVRAGRAEFFLKTALSFST